jgi:phage/plasmid-like protein (TIGR03299 family)
MAHELTIDAGTGRAEMAWAGQTPWHGLGQELDADAPMSDWIAAAGMGWKVRASVPLYADHTGCLRPFQGRKVLHRSDTGHALGVVSDAYKPVHPAQILEFFAELVDSRGYKLETAGTLYGGRKYWALARVMSDTPVIDPRDKVGRFLLLSTTADGSSATEARDTDVRVVCHNTITAAERTAAKHAWSHRQEWCPERAKADLQLVDRDTAEGRFHRQMVRFRALAERALTGREREDLTLKLFGIEDPWQLTDEGRQRVFGLKAPGRLRELTNGGGALVGETLDGAGKDTAWGWLNAVTQHADWEAQARSQSGRLDSAWFGRGAERKRRALELALATV